MENAPPKRKKAALIGLLLIVLIAVAVIAWQVLRSPSKSWVQGQVEVTQVRAGAKLTGRVLSIEVREGERVEQGQIIGTLDVPEAQARAAQADAQVAAARAQADKAETGAREEEIRASYAQWQAANAQAALAETTAQRMQRLFDDGVVPEQRRDEARATANSARAQANAAQEAWEMARSGARSEDIRAAQAQLEGAQGGREEVQVFLDEEVIYAPSAGEIARKIFEPGEILPAGAPLVMIAQTQDPWVTFNIREDQITNIRIDSVLSVRIPALGDEFIDVKVDYIAPLGDFATWRSTRDLGGFDLRTFEIQARPTVPVEGLRAGMSVLLPSEALAGSAL